MKTLATACLLATLLLAAPIAVPRAHAVEDERATINGGLFGRYTIFDTDFPADDALGIGGRLGWRFAPWWALELDASANTDLDDRVDMSYLPLHLRLVRTLAASERLRFHIGAGYVHSVYKFSGDTFDDENDDGFSFMAGFEHDINRSVAFRLDGVLDDNTNGYGPGEEDDWHFGLEFGLAFGNHARAARDGDEDLDGVPDSRDRCPGTPRGSVVDEEGCPKLFEEGKTEVILEGVNFETDKATLLPESKEILNRVADVLKAHPDIRVEVEGHTDNTGTAEHNQELSYARAGAVRDYLIDRGVSASRLEARGYGQESPVDTNDTEAGRARNRRVELKRIN